MCLFGIYDFTPLYNGGGVAKFNRNMIKCLKSIGYNVCFDSFYFKDEHGYSFLNKTMRGLNYISGYRISAILFKLWLKKNKPEYCIVNYSSLLRYCKKEDSKFLLIQHQSYSVLDRNNANLGLIKNRTLFFKKISKIIVLSEYDKFDFINNTGLSEKSFYILPHMVDLDVININKNATKSIAMIARLDNMQKRFDLAIDVMNFLPDFTLNIYGDGKDFNLIKSFIDKSNVKNVYLNKYPENLIEVLDRSSIHLMLSDFEGFGITNLEAAARGLPCVIRFTFPSAMDLTFDKGLIDKSATPEEISHNIKMIYADYEYYSKKTKKIAISSTETMYIRRLKRLVNEL